MWQHKKLPRTMTTAVSARGYKSSLRGKNRFRVSTRNFSHRNPTEAANERAQ